MKGGPALSPLPRQSIPASGVAQRTIGTYKAGTLAVTTLAMRNLSQSQMNHVQYLHDDTSKHYSIDEARQRATGVCISSNPYEWEVQSTGNYVTSNSGVQSILERFGHPTQSVVKTYDDLASRVGFDVRTNKGVLTTQTAIDLQQLFEASKPLHFAVNPFLRSTWESNMNDYNGSKKDIPLYGVMRSNLTKDFQLEDLGTGDLNEMLKAVSGRPPEVHHLLFKARYPHLANLPSNLMLSERSERESVFGPGQHELMHMVATGNDSNKFVNLLPQFVYEYGKFSQTL